MAERVFVHVGTPKSGTTYLQAGLWAQREALGSHGLLFPGRTPFDQNRASLLVRKNRVVWQLELGGGGLLVIPRATLLAELQKYAAKQKARVGAGG